MRTGLSIVGGRPRPRSLLAALIGGAVFLFVARIVGDCGNVGEPRGPRYAEIGGAS